MEDIIKIDKHEFVIEYNFEDIIKKLEVMKTEYEEESFVPIWYREFEDEKRKYLTEKDYIENIEQVEKELSKLQNMNMESYIIEFPKKKNGTFNLRNKIKLIECDNATFNGDYCGRWDYCSLEIIPVNDKKLRLGLFETSCQESGF